jgi:hypothetical protein
LYAINLFNFIKEATLSFLFFYRDIGKSEPERVIQSHSEKNDDEKEKQDVEDNKDNASSSSSSSDSSDEEDLLR